MQYQKNNTCLPAYVEVLLKLSLDYKRIDIQLSMSQSKATVQVGKILGQRRLQISTSNVRVYYILHVLFLRPSHVN